MDADLQQRYKAVEQMAGSRQKFLEHQSLAGTIMSRVLSRDGGDGLVSPRGLWWLIFSIIRFFDPSAFPKDKSTDELLDHKAEFWRNKAVQAENELTQLTTDQDGLEPTPLRSFVAPPKIFEQPQTKQNNR